MRKENYLIALINKDILDLHIPFPFLRNSVFITKTIEWGLTYPNCVICLLCLITSVKNIFYKIRYSLFNLVFDERQTIEADVMDPMKR